MKNIDKVLIPSGPSDKIDIQRASGAINIFGKNANYVILGAGPDIYEAFEYFVLKKEIPKNLDHHVALCNFVSENIDGKAELIIHSTTAVQNILEFFENELQGNYAIVSDSWQLSKYKHIVNNLKKKGKVSENADLEYYPIKTDKYYNWFEKIASKLKTDLELLKI